MKIKLNLIFGLIKKRKIKNNKGKENTRPNPQTTRLTEESKNKSRLIH
jgi:hypothetical protein